MLILRPRFLRYGTGELRRHVYIYQITRRPIPDDLILNITTETVK
jgi:hypothetical protein